MGHHPDDTGVETVDCVDRVSRTEPTTTSFDPRSPKRGGADSIRADDTVAALRALRYGAADDPTRSIALPPTVRASVSPTISALRWGAVGYGLVLGATVVIQLRSEDNAGVVAAWTLTRARPSKWTGPTLAAKGASDVAMEELVLVCEDISFE